MKPGTTRSQRTPHRLTLYRRERKVSMRELAEKAGLSAPTISHLESGHRRPHVATQRAIAEALGVAVEQIWPPSDADGSDERATYWDDPDADPDEPDWRALGLDTENAVIYLDRPRVDMLDERGRVVATHTPERLVIHSRSGMRVELLPRRVVAGARPRARRTRSKSSSTRGGRSSDDGPGEPAQQARRP